MFLIALDSDELVMKQSLFNTSDFIYWKIDMTIIAHFESQSLNSSSSLKLKVNSIPLNGSCEINLRNGTALFTLFTILCDNWIDMDGKVARYEYLSKIKFLSNNL